MLYKIILENYRPYTYHVEVFHKGLNLIVGGNGTGKTSVVEAISYALFGNMMTRGPANTWIKEGAKHGKVTLFIDDFIIIRGDNEQLVKDASGKIIARLHSGVNAWVLETFGLTAELYATANYIAQKDIESFSSLQTADRIKRVEKLLRIDILDRIKIKVASDAKEYKTTIKAHSSSLEGVVFDEKVLKKAENDKTFVLSELLGALEEQKDLLIAKGQYEGQLRDWNRKLLLKRQTKDIKFHTIPYTSEELIGYKQKLIKNISIQKSLKDYEDIIAKDVSKLIQEKLEIYNAKKSEFDLLKDFDYHVDLVGSICPTCGETVSDTSTLLKRRDVLEKELSVLTEEGKKLRLQQKKFELLAEIDNDVPEDIETIEQMIIDKEKLPYLVQYKELEKVKEPVEVDTSKIDLKILKLQKEMEEYTDIINQQEENKRLINMFAGPLKEAQSNLDECLRFIDLINKYRKEFSKNVIPLIAKNAKTIFDHLTDFKFPSFKINKDYSIEKYYKYSGSENDSANFALRMAIAQVSRITGFNIIILDEIAASFDTNKEKLLMEVLGKTTQQLIYISHNPEIIKENTNDNK